MKTLIIFLLFNLPIEKTFCDGWDDGYCQGWEFVKGPEFSICPLPPLCPLPEIYQEEYKDGYHRGFLKGRKDAKED